MNVFYSTTNAFFQKNLFKISFLYLLFSSLLSSAQTQQNVSEDPTLWNKESFGSYDFTKELVYMRDAHSKHFLNADGTITALIAAGNFHYLEENNWKTIYHSIVKNENGFENLTNNHKTYFPSTSNGNLITRLPNNIGTLREMLDMRMYYEVNGNSVQVQNIHSKNGTSNFNELTYKDVYGFGIDLKLTQNTTKRKMDYIIQSQSSLGIVPQNADYLVFEETIELPSGWIAKLENNEIQIINQFGNVVALYEKPIFYDTPNDVPHEHLDHDHHSEHQTIDHDESTPFFELIRNENILIIKTKVPINWLLSIERNYPVTIDPTINFTPDNTTDWTGSVNTWTTGLSNPGSYTSTNIHEGFNDRLFLGHACGGGYYDGASYVNGSSIDNARDVVGNGWMKFNTASMPPPTCVNSISVNSYVYAGHATGPPTCKTKLRVRHLANDPVSASNATRLSDIRDGTIYADFDYAGALTSWRSFNLNSSAFSLVYSGTLSFGMEVYETYQSHHEHDYMLVRGYSDVNKPYLVVNYTPQFLAQWVSVNSGCSQWYPGETRNVSVTVTNAGCTAWTSGGAGNNVNFSWWGNWAGQHQDANPRMFPYSNLTQGNSQVITFSVTAPMALGAYTINVDNVRDGFCWFRNNDGVCGPGNSPYSFNFNVVNSTATTSNVSVCVGGTVDASIALPTGGTITTSGSDRIHRFTATGNFVSPTVISGAQVLVVGGGGAGGFRHAGGGGAGGVIHQTGVTIPTGTTVATIGAGGVGTGGDSNGNDGQSSSFSTITALGGGGGGTNGLAGRNGGSGGGGSNGSFGGNGTAGQGFKGGNQNNGAGCCAARGCGGGGAGAAGANTAGNNASAGGVGISNSITGAAVFYGGGGGGGTDAATALAGGNGGGGAGGTSSSMNGVNGTANTGGGGGGGGANGVNSGNGGNGGSGVVIVRYTLPTYTSDNPAVATVNSAGVVTGVSNGTANISVAYSGSCFPVHITTVTVGATSTAPTSITGGGTICQGNAPTLTSVGGTSGPGAMNVWYTGGCNNAFTQTWNSNPYTTWNTTVNSITGGIMSLTSTSNDPMIEMPLLGSFSPTVFRYINVRYRVTAGTAGAMELFFHNAHWTFAHGEHHTWAPLISDNQWHIATLDLTQNAHFLADASNITGWRYDWATNSGVTMELDFIQLSQYPMIDENNTDAILVLTPGSSYYPAPGSTVTYASGRIDQCSATGCQSTTVTLPAQSAILGTNGQQATCTVNANETVSFFHVGSGNYIATVTAGATGLGSVTATVYDNGSPLAVPACGSTAPQFTTSVMERHWVITPTTNGSANVWLPYYNTELTSLTTAANANANLQDDVAGQGSVLLSKYSGGTWPASVNVDSDPFNNCAPPVSTGAGGTILIGNNGFGTVQSYLALFPATTLYSRYPITGFSEFWLHGQINSPLPIILSDFSATCDEQTKISWSTSSEVNSAYFVVEKSRDGINWEEVETVPGKGLSTTLSTYQVIDDQEFELIYYRLKQVDIDNNTTYFGPISVDCNAKNKLSVYPNPSDDDFTIEIVTKSLMKDVQVVLYDVSGKIISSKKIDLINGTHLYTIDATGLEKGTYIVGIAGENKNEFIPIKVVLY